MLSQVLNDLNLRSIIPSRFAKLISDNKDGFLLLDTLGNLIYESSLKGKKSVTLEVIRSKKYETCKEFESSNTYQIVASELKSKEYKVYLTFNIDEAKDEYYGEVLIDWN